jgi:hypothetical protein
MSLVEFVTCKNRYRFDPDRFLRRPVGNIQLADVAARFTDLRYFVE